MEYKNIQLSFDAGVATVTLDRPQKRNAISFALVEELLGALDAIERSSTQVVILTGAGKAFCAGLDLDELKGLLGNSHEENLRDSSRMGHIFRRLYDFPLPTIAAVNGAAVAGGTGFATMCDFTLAVPDAKFGYTEVRIGFVPAIVSSMLVWQVGHKIARDLLLSGRLFDAAEAYRSLWRLVASGDTVVEPLLERLKPGRSDVTQVRQWILDLSSPSLATGLKASKMLREALDQAGTRAELEKALGADPSKELRSRLEALLLAPPNPLAANSPQTLQTSRALGVLERLATPKAREALRALASGEPSRLSREARSAVARLEALQGAK